MYLLRRTAFRAASSASISTFAKARPLSASLTNIVRSQQQWIKPTLVASRFYSDEVKRADGVISEDGSATTAPIATETAPPAVDEEASVAAATATAGESSAAPAARSPASMKAGLYVGNLFFEVTEDQLRKVFSKFGEIISLKIVYDARGLNRGYAFVDFVNKEDAAAAVENLHQQVFEGRRLVVQHHVPRARPRLETPLQANPPSTSLFIGNMSFEMSDKDLNDLFREIRDVTDVRVAIDRRSGRPRGFAHADFLDIASAEKAKEILSEKEIYGRKLRVDFSHNQANKAASRAERRDSANRE